MDIEMPNLDGLSATQQIRKIEKENNLPETKIIGTTGYSDETSKFISCGMSHCLIKPIYLQNLLQFISEK
jgi:CheY-like chemotaxis protein